ncbi:hypothetical protein [Actinoplanes sp. NPDC049599]|uniref:hypothetical protein n=1 Tax=Actinoplanes sp. NPDC049599 TaxID=3363903 RepID=UPI0037A1DADA
MSTVEHQRRAGHSTAATAAGVRAAVDSQMRGVNTNAQNEMRRLDDAMDKMARTPGVSRDQVERLREDQRRQLDGFRRGRQSILELLRGAADDLDARHQGQTTACQDDPAARGQLAQRQSGQSRALDRLRERSLDELRQIGARQDGMLADQRRGVRQQAAASPGPDGAVGHRADELAAKRAEQEKKIETLVRDLADRIRAELTAGAGAAPPSGPGGDRMPAGRSRGARVDADRGMWETMDQRPGPLSAEESARVARETLARDPRQDPIRALVDRIGSRAAEILTAGDPRSPQAVRERLRERFAAARQAGDDRAAGTAFHRAAELAARERSKDVPPGWRMDAELRLPDQPGNVDSRLDLLFHRPGEAKNFDWKTTGAGALRSQDEMQRHEQRARDFVGSRYGTDPADVAMEQESRSWNEYVTSGSDPRLTASAEHAIKEEAARQEAARERQRNQSSQP